SESRAVESGVFCVMLGRPPSSPLFPYTTLFRSPEAWLELVETRGHGVADGEVLTRSVEADEFLLMGLRLVEGIDLSRYEQYAGRDRKSTRLNSSHVKISYAVFCLKKKNLNSSTD